MTIKRRCVFFLERLLGIQEFGNVASSSEVPDAAMLVLLMPEEIMALHSDIWENRCVAPLILNP
jgi:hypothetical protein